MAQDLIEVDRTEGNEGRVRIAGRDGKPFVVAGDENLTEIAVGLLDGRYSVGTEFIDEPVLKGAVDALSPAAGLG